MAKRTLLLLLVGLLAGGAARAESSGHLKSRLLAESYGDASLLRDFGDPLAIDIEADLRLQLATTVAGLGLDAAWQLAARHGESVASARELAGLLPVAPTDSEARRALDLEDTLVDDGRRRAVQRIDRLALSWTSERSVVRLGRQALTWGNGLYFSPLDIVNPFDPSTIDTEYKAGDDMLYLQNLRGNGDDVEAAWVFRRDPAGGPRAEVATAALRYNGYADDAEYQLLVARHYGGTRVGLGGSLGVRGAVWRADLGLADADGGGVEFVGNWSYGWRWRERNVTGALEYYFNGYGLHGGRYSLSALAAAPELAARLARGDAFTVGRHYLAGVLDVELHPLYHLRPTLLANAVDRSALLQLVFTASLADNVTAVAVAELPLGPAGSEFRGLESPVAGRYLSRRAGLFVQLAWYFPG